MFYVISRGLSSKAQKVMRYKLAATRASSSGGVRCGRTKPLIRLGCLPAGTAAHELGSEWVRSAEEGAIAARKALSCLRLTGVRGTCACY